MAEEQNFPRLGPLETIFNVGWPGGIAILEYATETVAGSSTPPPGTGGLEVLQTLLTGPDWLPTGVPIFEGSFGEFTTGKNLRVPAGTKPPIIDPISAEMRKLLVWSAPPTTDIVTTASRFGTGRALIFFNCAKIFSEVNKGKSQKEQKKEFTFTLNTIDPHIFPGSFTGYYLWDASQGTFEAALALPELRFDPLRGKPDSDIKGYIYVPALYATEAEANVHAASIHWFSGPMITPFVFDDSISNTVRWRARLTTYKKQPKKTDPNAPPPPKPKKQFPVGSGEIDTLLDETLTPAPGWNVDAATNEIVDTDPKDIDIQDKTGDVSDKERSNDITTRPETACTLTFKIKKKTTEGPKPTVILEPSIVRDPDRR